MKTVFVSSNKLNLVQLCPYKAHLEQDIGITAFERPEPLEKGDLLHRMLEHYYKGMMNPEWKRELVIEEAVEIARRATAQELDLEIAPSEEIVLGFRQYVDNWKYDQWVPLAVEAPFSKVLYEREDTETTEGIRIISEGKIDLVIRLRDNVIVVDHKGVARDQRTLDLSNQFINYCWAVGKNTLFVNKIGFQKSKKIDERFTRQLLSYTDDRIEEWITNSIAWVHIWLRYKESEFFPKNLTSCDKWGGCTFREVCRADPGTIRDWKIKTLFKERSPYDIFQGQKERGGVKFVVSGGKK